MYSNNACLSDFSSLSVLCAVDKFIKSVDTMNDTILVPSRLLEMDPKSSTKSLPVLMRGHGDTYSFYSHLNNIKNELLWGASNQNDEDSPVLPDNRTQHPWFVPTLNGKIEHYPITNNTNRTEKVKTHARQSSQISLPCSSSESEIERLSDSGDSGVEHVESTEDGDMVDITTALKGHLGGLQDCLIRLKDTADYITSKYKEEFDF